MKRATVLLMLAAIGFGIEAAAAFSTLRGVLEGGTELDVDI